MCNDLKSSPLLLPLGLLYLLIILYGIYAHFVIRIPLLEAASDAERLHLFFSRSSGIRLSLVADIAMVMAEVVVGLAYILDGAAHFSGICWPFSTNGGSRRPVRRGFPEKQG